MSCLYLVGGINMTAPKLRSNSSPMIILISYPDLTLFYTEKLTVTVTVGDLGTRL